MFKKFRNSALWKAGGILLVVGAILIAFNNWISRVHFSVGFDTLNKTLMPFYIGIILTLLLCPIYNRIVRKTYQVVIDRDVSKQRYIDPNERRRVLAIAKAVSSAVCFVLVVGLFALLIYAIVPQVVTSCVQLYSNMPERLSILSDWLEKHFSRFPELAAWVDRLAKAGTTEIFKWVQENVVEGDFASLAAAISASVLTAVSYVMNFVIGILIMIYLLNYKEKLVAIVRKMVAATCKQKTQDELYELCDILNETFIGFIVGRIIDSFIIGILTYITLTVCGISFAPMISVIVGVTNVIPFFGPFIGAIPSVMILMLESPVQALYFLVIILVIQQLDGNVIGPKIVGNAVGIESFWVLVTVLIGGGLFGFVGMAFGVPVFAVAYRYINKLTTRKLDDKERESRTTYYMSLESYGIDSGRINMDKKHSEKSFLKRFTRIAPEYDTMQEDISETSTESEFDPDAEPAGETDNDEANEIKKVLSKEFPGIQAIRTTLPRITHRSEGKKDVVRVKGGGFVVEEPLQNSEANEAASNEASSNEATSEVIDEQDRENTIQLVKIAEGIIAEEMHGFEASDEADEFDALDKPDDKKQLEDLTDNE